MDSQSNADIISRLTTTLGKSKETLAEEAEKEAEKNNPANFGLNFGYFCITMHNSKEPRTTVQNVIIILDNPGLIDTVSAVNQVKFHVLLLFLCQGILRNAFLVRIFLLLSLKLYL